MANDKVGDVAWLDLTVTNADLPPVWMPYFIVADINESATAVEAKGGSLLTEIKPMGGNDKFDTRCHSRCRFQIA